MTHEIKKLPGHQTQIVVEISVKEQKPFLEKASQQLSKEYKIPGFRPGKVPFSILKEKVGESKIYQEAAHLMIEETYPAVCVEEKLITVASPKIEIIKVAPNNPFIYKAIVPLLPTVKLGQYKKFKAQKKKIKVEEKQVDKVLHDLKQMRAKEILIDKKAEKGNKVELDFAIYLDKLIIEGGRGKKVELIVGEGYFIPGFEEQIIGLKAGEEKKFKLVFPKNYYQKNLANREADFHVKVNAIYQRTLPELNDEFAQNLGNKFKSLTHLKEELFKNLELEAKTKEDQRFELAILEEIIGHSEFEEIPEILLEGELDKMMMELRAEIESRQLKFEDYLNSIKKTVDELRKEFEDKAIKRIKTALITRAIAKKEEIDITDEEVAAEIQKTIDLYPNDEEVKKKLATPQYFSYLKNVLVSKKVYEFLSKIADK